MRIADILCMLGSNNILIFMCCPLWLSSMMKSHEGTLYSVSSDKQFAVKNYILN